MQAPEYIDHKGKRILFIDLSDLKVQDKQEALDRIDLARDAIAKHEPNSLLVLTNVHNARFDKEIAKYMREYVAHNKPFIKRSAVLGLSGLQIPLYNAINKITGRSMRSFSSELQAKDWLVQES